MTFTLTPIPVKKSDGTPTPIIAYNDGTNNAFANAVLDATGAIVSPATAANQTAANTSLAAIATNTTGSATAAAQATGNSALATVATTNTSLDTNLGAKADAVASTDTGTFSLIALVKRALGTLTTLATNTTSLATATAQATGNTKLDSIVTACQAATPAGTNLIGKVGIDQTTPGTTNLVQLGGSLPAGSNLIGAVAQVGTSVHLTAAPAVTAGAYTSGMVVGGLITLSGAARVNAGSGVVQSVLVTVKTALTSPFDVLFFDTNPANSTFTDNAALAVNTADLPYLVGAAHCNDLVAAGTPQVLQANNCGINFKLSAANTNLYAVIVLRGGQTFASTSAVGLSAVVQQD